MSRQPRVCADIEPELLAAATGEAEPAAGERVRAHLERCAPCAAEYRAYQALERAVDTLRRAPVPEREITRARRRLEARLGRQRRRTLFYRVFPSPLGNLLIATSERGVSLVEYLWDATDVRRSRLARLADVEAVASRTARWKSLRTRRRSSGQSRLVRRPSRYSSSSR